MSDEREKTLKDIRSKAIQETEKLATTQRFALFSSPVPLGLGDDSYDHKQRPPRNEQGKPITSPPNFKVQPARSGKIQSSFFSKLGFTSIGDQYIDPDRRQRIQELKEKQKYATEDRKRFIPPPGYKTLVSSAYQHEQDYDIPKPKIHKDSNGNVQVGPRNIFTNPRDKKLEKYPEHLKDEYDRYHQFEKARMEEDHKILKDKSAFKSTIHVIDNFSKDKDVFGLDKMPPEKHIKEIDLKPMKHEQPFKPSHPTKSGYQGCLNKYPEYKGDPLESTKRRDFEKDKAAFKPNNLGNKTRPTPSVSCFPHNLKREMNARVF
ncbi:hypothetical protein pb186bvf_015104 [Paramecium bursaria]